MLAKVFFWLAIGTILAAAIAAAIGAIINFDRFLPIALTALVMLTGICWAVRTTNVHQYKVAERNMETYIWLYDDADSKMKRAYRRIIENYNRTSKYFLFSAKLFSYMTLYLLFSVLCLFTAEMLVLIYNSPQDCCLSQSLWVWRTAVVFAILSGLSFAFVCVSFGMYFDIIDKCKCTECFRKCSALLTNTTVILREDWIESYRKTGNGPELTEWEIELEDILYKYEELRNLPGVYVANKRLIIKKATS